MNKATPSSEDRLVFRKHDRLGAADAEEDKSVLLECFVDTGDLRLLTDCDRPERIVLGRTGAGKSALILRLLEHDRAIEIKPENLALSYITNSTIIQFFEQIGVNLDPFYKLIWRHAFCVELLRERFGFRNGQEKFGLLDKIRAFFKGSQYSAAIKYLETWGESFWEETEHRVKEITKKIEESLRGSVKTGFSPTELSTEGIKTLSEEQRTEITQRAQKVVNEAHVPQLNQIVDLVRDVLDDAQKRYYLVIDRLDESWADDQLRYKLIMALLDTVKEFRRVNNAKIIVALRVDLLQKVYKHARRAGFQEEKMEPLYLKLEWSRGTLSQLIDARVNHMFRDRYSKNRLLSARDVLFESKNEVSSLDYILDRTFLRPRDAICFFNECIKAAEGRSKIALKDIRAAEGAYSIGRLQSVADEWHAEFPNLLVFAKALLANTQHQGRLGAMLTEPVLQERCLSLHGRPLPHDNFVDVCNAVVAADRPCQAMMHAAASIFYRVGIIGVKFSSTEGFSWHSETGRRLDATELNDDTSVRIHPMFWRALGVAATE